MTDLPDWAEQDGNTVYVETAMQAIAVVEYLPEDGNEMIVVRDQHQAKILRQLMAGF